MNQSHGPEFWRMNGQGELWASIMMHCLWKANYSCQINAFKTKKEKVYKCMKFNKSWDLKEWFHATKINAKKKKTEKRCLEIMQANLAKNKNNLKIRDIFQKWKFSICNI